VVPGLVPAPSSGNACPVPVPGLPALLAANTPANQSPPPGWKNLRCASLARREQRNQRKVFNLPSRHPDNLHCLGCFYSTFPAHFYAILISFLDVLVTAIRCASLSATRLATVKFHARGENATCARASSLRHRPHALLPPRKQRTKPDQKPNNECGGRSLSLIALTRVVVREHTTLRNCASSPDSDELPLLSNLYGSGPGADQIKSNLPSACSRSSHPIHHPPSTMLGRRLLGERCYSFVFVSFADIVKGITFSIFSYDILFIPCVSLLRHPSSRNIAISSSSLLRSISSDCVSFRLHFNHVSLKLS
jgi:hypothetical protein